MRIPKHSPIRSTILPKIGNDPDGDESIAFPTQCNGFLITVVFDLFDQLRSFD